MPRKSAAASSQSSSSWRGGSRIPLSIDTYKAEVAEAALDRGALIVNDVSAPKV